MSRNGSGSYTLPASVNPVVDATTITIAWANTTLNDVATAITDSLDRNGKGEMLAPLVVPVGSAAAPTIRFSGDTQTGLYRAGDDDVRMSIAGSDRLKISATGADVTGAATVSSTLQVTGDTTLSGAAHIVGAITADSTISSKKITATGGAGVEGAELANGTAATGAAPTNALVLSNGHLSMAGVVDPNSTLAINKVLVPGLIPRAWARIAIDAAGVLTINDAMNVASAAIVGGGTVVVTLAQAMASTNFAPIAQAMGVVSWAAQTEASAVNTVDVRAYETSGAGAAITWTDGTARHFSLVVFGRQ